MALKSNPHVKGVSVTLELDGKGNVEQVTHVETDLHLDALDKLHNKAGVASVITDAEAYARSPGFWGRISISGT